MPGIFLTASCIRTQLAVFFLPAFFHEKESLAKKAPAFFHEKESVAKKAPAFFHEKESLAKTPVSNVSCG